MSFSKPKSVKIPPQEQVEDIERVEETQEEAEDKKRKRLASMKGYSSTMAAGISKQLKQKLGQ